MFAALNRFFAMLTAYFIAMEKVGNSAVNLADWAEKSTASFADEADIDRKIKLSAKKAELRAQELRDADPALVE